MTIASHGRAERGHCSRRKTVSVHLVSELFVDSYPLHVRLDAETLQLPARARSRPLVFLPPNERGRCTRAVVTAPPYARPYAAERARRLQDDGDCMVLELTPSALQLLLNFIQNR